MARNRKPCRDASFAQSGRIFKELYSLVVLPFRKTSKTMGFGPRPVFYRREARHLTTFRGQSIDTLHETIYPKGVMSPESIPWHRFDIL